MTTPTPFGHRRNIRLPAFDYDTPAAYFVTIVSHERRLIFGSVDGEIVHLSAIGEVVSEEWLKTADLRPQVELNVFVVMPNHMHAVVRLGQRGEATARRPHWHRLSRDSSPR